MNDKIEITILENSAQFFRVTDVAHDHAESGARSVLGNIRPFGLRRIEVVEIVNDHDVPTAFLNQVVNKMRANETGTAGHQNIFVHERITARIKLNNRTGK